MSSRSISQSADAANDLTSGDETHIFSHSSFFQENRAKALPSPSKIRAINKETGGPKGAQFRRPPPVKMEELGLLVKYGGDVTVAEAQTQLMVRQTLGTMVPVPEVYAWARDGNQTFIYMSLVQGDTLMVRWPSLKESERLHICTQLRTMTQHWRTTLRQDEGDSYIGSLGKLRLNEIFFRDRENLPGPFLGSDAINKFQQVCNIKIDATDVPIVFTHADLVPPNILLTLGPSPNVAAVIDWGQSGWYPSYWEYCKARWIRLMPKQMSPEVQDEWYSRYMPIILDSVDEESVYHPWVKFALAKGI